ncbi:hypothetical protein ES703_77377 [subsurface metagenome]
MLEFSLSATERFVLIRNLESWLTRVTEMIEPKDVLQLNPKDFTDRQLVAAMMMVFLTGCFSE